MEIEVVRGGWWWWAAMSVVQPAAKPVCQLQQTGTNAHMCHALANQQEHRPAPCALKPLGAHTQPSTAFQGPSGIRMGAAGMLKSPGTGEAAAATPTARGALRERRLLRLAGAAQPARHQAGSARQRPSLAPSPPSTSVPGMQYAADVDVPSTHLPSAPCARLQAGLPPVNGEAAPPLLPEECSWRSP